MECEHVLPTYDTNHCTQEKHRFRWVSCQIDVLGECLDWPSVKRELNNLPQTLDATYQRTLQSMNEQNRRAATRLLQFLTYMKRPLRLEEAVDVVAVDFSERPRFDPANRVPIPAEVLRYCSSLVIMTSRENEEDHTIIKEIQLAHFSVQEYLMSSRTKGYLSNDLEKSVASAAILDTCLAYLLDIDHPNDRVQANERFPLAQYSAQSWLDHASIVEQATEKASASVLEYLLSDQFQYIQGLYLANLEPADSISRPWLWRSHFDRGDRIDGLYCASRGGLFHATQALLIRGANANALWGELCGGVWYGWDSALCAPSDLNYPNIVQILLDHGANVNGQWARFGNALCAASGANNANIVQILFDHGADINAHPTENALQRACRFGATESALTLLGRGADISASGIRGTALRVALEGGHAETARMLLHRGARFDVEWFAGYYSPFSVLLMQHTTIVRILFEQGVDFSAEDPGLGTPLYLAASKGYTEVVQILLDYGVGAELLANTDIRTGGRKCFNPIQGAAKAGFKNIIHILLNHGINVNARAGDGPIALHDATSRGHAEIVRMLLQHGANINDIAYVFNGSSWLKGTALHVASLAGHLEIVRILLQHGVDVNIVADIHIESKCVEGTEEIASLVANSEIVRLLLQHGAVLSAILTFT